MTLGKQCAETQGSDSESMNDGMRHQVPFPSLAEDSII